MRHRVSFFILFIIFGLLFGLQANAVTESSSILMNIVPENPNPGEDVTITLSSFAEDLDTANIAWFINNKSISSGIAKKSISLKAPSAGSETSVLAIITFPDSKTQVSTIIKPTEMVILWQALDSYTPPFYKGKALPAPDTFVKAVAMPEIMVNNTPLNANNMIYSWKKDFSNIQDANGYGKNFLIFRNDYLENSNNIGVTANTIDNKYSSASRVNIRMFDPELLFYKKDISLGTVWNMALGDNYFIKNNDILVASPYFISPRDIRRPDLLFRWFINDSPIDIANYQKTVFPLVVEPGTSGTSKVKLEIESTDKIFQTAKKEINIQF